MKLIESKVEYIPQEPSLEGVYKQIELAGRTCYKSENKITPNSAKSFVDRMIASGHYAMLEHGTIYLNIPITTHYSGDANVYLNSPYCNVNESNGFNFKDIYGDNVDCWCVTTNLRYIQENNLWNDIKDFLCEPTEYHERRITLKFITDRGVSHELVRHRAFSFAQESTRYCNYSKGRFGNELTFIIPSWINPMCIENQDHFDANTFYRLPQQPCIESAFFGSCLNAENYYKNLITEDGLTPQQARQILPNALKTEIVMTGFAYDWKHFFDLRYFCTTGKPHPDMLELTTKAKKVLEDNNLWNLIYQ